MICSCYQKVFLKKSEIEFYAFGLGFVPRSRKDFTFG